MGIRVSTKTRLPASLKLMNNINTFLFEQEYDELKYYTPAEIECFRHAAKLLSKVIKDNK